MPPWLRRLALATFLQAARDLRKPEHAARARKWLREGGRLGDSDWTVRSVLKIADSKSLLEAATKLAQNPNFTAARTLEQAMDAMETVDA